MEKTLRDTIKEITKKHLEKFKSMVFGQNLLGGWVDNTLPKLYERWNYRIQPWQMGY